MEGPLYVEDDDFQKMRFIYNALETGWDVKKRKSVYVFSKKHEGKKEIFEESFLQEFIRSNFEIR